MDMLPLKEIIRQVGDGQNTLDRAHNQLKNKHL
jgi:hypothetical protein